jgi:ribonuclease HII
MKQHIISKNEVGLDESGTGTLFGRVYAGAVIWPENLECDLINDSKKLNKKKRINALEWIKNNITHWSYGFAEVSEIDDINILNASQLAMQRAVEKLNILPDNLIIDGNRWTQREIKGQLIPYQCIVKGDSKVYSIAAASIIAKEYHDEHIREICTEEIDNKYGLLKNMGYSTKQHMEAIMKYGITEYHRKTFSPCNKMIK